MATTTTTAPALRKSDVSRAVGRVLGKDKRAAYNGWDVIGTGSGIMITLNHFSDDQDRDAFDALRDALGTRYELTFTAVLNDYSWLPEEYRNCATIDVRRITPAATPAPATPEEHTMPEPTAPAAPLTPEFRGITRDDVATAAVSALETLSADDRAIVEGKAPSVVLGVAFRRAQSAWCADRREHTADESAAYDRTANLASAAMIFEREDNPAAARTAMADHTRIENEERAAETARREEAYAKVLESQWRDAPVFGQHGYPVRTEDRGHGIVAVYVKGPADDIEGVNRTAAAYARAQGFKPSASASGGGEITGKGSIWIAQQIYRTS